jgi:glycosyltransferase involved in cell wall biosynthesis
MAHVVHLITGLSVGGAETALFRLLTSPGAPHTRAVICLSDEGYYGPLLREAGIAVHALGMRRGRFSLRAFIKLVRLLREMQPDILQTWLYHADLLGLFAARIAGLPTVLWNVRCSAGNERELRRGAGPLVRLLARLSHLPAAVISNSIAGRSLHDAIGYRPKRWVVIPNGIDTTLFRPSPEHHKSLRIELGIPSHSLLVGLVARLDPLKNHAMFLRAAQQVAAHFPEVHFVCAGQGIDSSNSSITELAQELGLEGRLHLLGLRSDMPRLTSALDVAACTSSAEGFPNTLIEAMACGVPCVSTNVGDAELIVNDTGAIVRPGDAAHFAERVSALLRSHDLRHEKGAAARARVLALYSLEAMTEAYRQLYESILENASSVRSS